MNLYEEVMKLVADDFDVIELFGDTGTGKSTFFLEVCKAAVLAGKTVRIIDTEKNFNKKIVDEFTKRWSYIYMADFKDTYDYIVKDKKLISEKYDVILLDSLGLQVLGEFAKGTMKAKGDILLKCQAIADAMRKYAVKHKALVLITNQPQSIFGKGKEFTRNMLGAFGDKHAFFIKEIWKSFVFTQSEDMTSCYIKAWRSRFTGKGTRLFDFTIDDDGIQVTPKYKVEEKSKRQKTPKKKKKKTPKVK